MLFARAHTLRFHQLGHPDSNTPHGHSQAAAAARMKSSLGAAIRSLSFLSCARSLCFIPPLKAARRAKAQLRQQARGLVQAGRPCYNAKGGQPRPGGYSGRGKRGSGKRSRGSPRQLQQQAAAAAAAAAVSGMLAIAVLAQRGMVAQQRPWLWAQGAACLAF